MPFWMPMMLGGKLSLSASMENSVSLASRCCWMRSAYASAHLSAMPLRTK